MSFNRKRDRIQIIAEILNSCKNPQTPTYIRRQTNVSYAVLQSCLLQLHARQWILPVEHNHGQKKLALTPKGMIFLEKWIELQKLAGIKTKRQLVVPLPEMSSMLIQSK
jgi:predicted transcriptional regulator